MRKEELNWQINSATHYKQSRNRRQDHRQNLTITISSASGIRQDHTYTWIGNLEIKNTGHLEIKNIILISVSGEHGNRVPQKVRKHVQFPMKGVKNIEPQDLEKTCQELAERCHRVTREIEALATSEQTAETRQNQRERAAHQAVQQLIEKTN